MKKLQFPLFVLVVSFCTFFYSCKKADYFSSAEAPIKMCGDNIERNEATWAVVKERDQIKLPKIRLKIILGHTINQCGGKCIKIFGQYGHIDCVGFGNVCNHVVNTELSKMEPEKGDGGYMLTLLEPDALGQFLEYPFPNRSFFITNPLNNSELWLNIPEQELIRYNYEELFLLRNVWFSEEPELENE